MLEKSFGLLFYLRKPKRYVKGPRYVYLRLTVDGRVHELATKRMWDPARWDTRSNRATGTREDARALNAYLDVLQAKVYEARRQLLEAGQLITARALKELLSGAAQRKRLLFNVFEEHNREVRELVGKKYAPGTWERYDTALRLTREFLQDKYRLPDINIHSLDLEFVKALYHWFRTVRACNHNTAVKYIGNLKKVVLLCVDHGWLARDPFALFDMSRDEVEPVFLTREELEGMATRSFEQERLAVVRDVFVFCCCTGLAFIDCKQLKRSEVTIGVDGQLWIDKKRQKSHVPSRIPLLPITLEILERYRDHPRCIKENRLLPVFSNTKYNAYLKEIAGLCGIGKNLTTHTARHTFGTTVTLAHGVPMETVSKMLGHKHIRQTEHYARVLPIKISEDMGTLKNKLEQNRFLKGIHETGKGKNTE